MGYTLVTVRFRVGEDQERSVTRVHAKLSADLDRMPPGALPPLVKPHSIDDVPILALTLLPPGTDRTSFGCWRSIWRTRSER